ncbi:MAG TPA: carboxypeptidase-like regulatory domain-containing protein, partial [Candidatus Dormibacteraeota bacterium]|nr:carboxypeptidase-like regulatory domain-containing protein [Candidatus Dormibacteraeota bacterium]
MRVRFLKRAVLCLLIGLWCLASPLKITAQQRLPGQSAPKNAALEGIVRQENGRPVIGARILLRGIATNQQSVKISDAQGVFRFLEVPPGAYEVT